MPPSYVEDMFLLFGLAALLAVAAFLWPSGETAKEYWQRIITGRDKPKL